MYSGLILARVCRRTTREEYWSMGQRWTSIPGKLVAGLVGLVGLAVLVLTGTGAAFAIEAGIVA